MQKGDNKALGVQNLADSDKLYSMTSNNLLRRRKKSKLGQNLQTGEVKTPDPLTRRQLLSQIVSL